MSMAANNPMLYHLIREYTKAVGASRTTIAALRSYIDAVNKLVCSEADFKLLVLELNGVIKNAEPKIVSLVHLIEEFETEMTPYFSGSMVSIKNRAADILTNKLKRFEADTARLTETCAGYIAPGDFIITGSPGSYIINAFIHAYKELKRPFKVLVLKQDHLRTRELVTTLDFNKIPYILIPQYNLSHFLTSVTRLFISAVSITSDHKAVTGFGTANVVSICHAHQVPVYLFMESLKFSHVNLSDQHIYMEEQDVIESDFTFHITTFSNDFVDLDLVDHLITEKGESRGNRIDQ